MNYDKKFKQMIKQYEEEIEKDKATLEGTIELLNRVNKWKTKGVRECE